MKNGSKLKEHDVAAQPEIVIEGAFVMPGSTYAVALVDVDVKRAVDGERQERLLWLQIGIPGPQDMGSTGKSGPFFSTTVLHVFNAGSVCSKAK